MTDDETDQPWRWWPSWNNRGVTSRPPLRFVGSTDRFDVFYDSFDDDYSLVHETGYPVSADPTDNLNFYIFRVDENDLIEFGVHAPKEELDPLNMCQLYQLLADFKEDKDA
jgi:hypothetical protein